MAAWFDRIAIYGPAPPKPKKEEKAEGELEGVVPEAAAGQTSSRVPRTAAGGRGRGVVSSADCWLPGYEYLMAYYLQPRETPRCKFSNTVFRPLALHNVGGTAPRPQITPTPPQLIWGGPSPIAQGAVPEMFGKGHRRSKSTPAAAKASRKIAAHPQQDEAGNPLAAPEGGVPVPRPSSRRQGEQHPSGRLEGGGLPLPPPVSRGDPQQQARRRRRTPSREKAVGAWGAEEERDRSSSGASRSGTSESRYSLRSGVEPAPPSGYAANGGRKEDSRAFRFVRKLYNSAHRENFALKKIAEQEEQVYGEALGSKKKGKRKLPGWLSGKKQTLTNDGSHFFWVCQY